MWKPAVAALNTGVFGLLQDRTELKSLENRKRNPLGKLPSFTDEFGTFYETGAILQWILKQYSNGRLQPPASDLASQQKMLQWCWFAEASIGAYNSIQNQHTRILPEDKRVEEVGYCHVHCYFADQVLFTAATQPTAGGY